MKKHVVLFAILGLVYSSFAQTNDSIPKKKQAAVADKFPRSRVLDLSYGYNGGYKYSSKTKQGGSSDLKVESYHQAGGRLNVNFFNRPSWSAGARIGYQYTALAIKQTDMSVKTANTLTKDFHYHYESLHLSHFSRLFGKMAIYSASLMTDGSDRGIERMYGTVSGIWVIKASPDVQMTIGLLGFVDRSAIIPLVPTFTYKKQYRSGWMIDLLLPQGAYMRKSMLRNGRLSLGSDLNTTTFYLYGFFASGKIHTLSQMEVNSGLTYEHNLGRSFIATLKSGMKTIPRSRIFEKGKQQSNYVWEASADPMFYVNAGLSFNPFATKKR